MTNTCFDYRRNLSITFPRYYIVEHRRRALGTLYTRATIARRSKANKLESAASGRPPHSREFLNYAFQHSRLIYGQYRRKNMVGSGGKARTSWKVHLKYLIATVIIGRRSVATCPRRLRGLKEKKYITQVEETCVINSGEILFVVDLTIVRCNGTGETITILSLLLRTKGRFQRIKLVSITTCNYFLMKERDTRNGIFLIMSLFFVYHPFLWEEYKE